jgi:hypothetical protein
MKQPELKERVRESTPYCANQAIDEKTLHHFREYGYAGPEAICQRLKELDKEWDTEKTLVVNASTLV